MLRKANNVFSVVLDDANVSATLSPGDLVNDTNLPAGAVALVDAGLRVTDLATLADGDTFFIVQGKGTGKKMMKSPALVKGNIKISTTPFKEALQQVTAVGFNYTSGSFSVANDTSYFIKIRKNDNDAANRSQPMSLFAQYKTSAAASQLELAFGLAKNGIKNMADEPANGYLRFSVIIDAAPLADATASSADVVYGSKVITTDVAATSVAIGDLVDLGGYVYVVDNISGTEITLNMPYQDVTATGIGFGYHTAASALTADFGVVLTGVEAPFDVNSFRDYYANRFTATFSDSATPVTHLDGAYNGNGTWQQVAMDEYMSYGYEGQNGMLGVPPALRDQTVKTPPTFAIKDCTYSAINIAWEESISGLVAMAGGKGNVICYVNLTTGVLAGTGTTGEALAIALGLTPSDLDS